MSYDRKSIHVFLQEKLMNYLSISLYKKSISIIFIAFLFFEYLLHLPQIGYRPNWKPAPSWLCLITVWWWNLPFSEQQSYQPPSLLLPRDGYNLLQIEFSGFLAITEIHKILLIFWWRRWFLSTSRCLLIALCFALCLSEFLFTSIECAGSVIKIWMALWCVCLI